MPGLRISRALISVSDKTGLGQLGRALARAGVEIIATGNTAKLLKNEGIQVTPIESVTQNPECFGGRLKTLSFQVFGGLLFRRNEPEDQSDAARLGIKPIDLVVVNFYPFESDPRVEQIDIGGPALVRAAAKNAPDVAVLTSPLQYESFMSAFHSGEPISPDACRGWAAQAWNRVAEYDRSIAQALAANPTLALRYGENPHQAARLEWNPEKSPIQWGTPLTSEALSYNNILDLSSAFSLITELVALDSRRHHVVIVKHNNPCGVASAPDQLLALQTAWECDPVSAFGGVLCFSHPFEEGTAQWLSERFVEGVAAPQLSAQSRALQLLVQKRKKLKAVSLKGTGAEGKTEAKPLSMSVVGGELIQTPDVGCDPPEQMQFPTKKKMEPLHQSLIPWGVAVCRTLKSNAVVIVGNVPGNEQVTCLWGAGSGQPNRIEAIEKLMIPRAREWIKRVLGTHDAEGVLKEALFVSDAFFPFRDAVDVSAQAGIVAIAQPGGSVKDGDSVRAANEQGIAMAFTGRRHFRH